MRPNGMHPRPASNAPALGDVATLAADIVLVGAFVISIGIPLYHEYGIIGHPALIAWYVASAALLPLALPLLVWAIRWGRPSRDITTMMLRASFLYSAPVLACVVAIVYAGLCVGLTGVAVMLYIAAVLVAVVHVPVTGTPTRMRMLVTRVASIVLTPLIVLGLTDALPHGLDAIQGWGIPMPVLAAGAYGCARALNKSLTAGIGRSA